MAEASISPMLNLFLFASSAAFIAFSLKRYIKITTSTIEKTISKLDSKTSEVETATHEPHPTDIALRRLIELDGAGSWPPRSTHGQAWPVVLRPFHDIYLDLVPSLSTAEPSTDDVVNYQRCLDYRAKYKHALDERVNLEQVDVLLSAGENGDSNTLSTEAWNGFFACIALSRHAYRWGTIPIVKLAQEEQVVDIPKQLEIPWEHLKRRFGVTSQGGNIYSNYLCNFDNNAQTIYPINPAMSDTIRSAEYHFARLLFGIEEQALPIYHLVTKSMNQHTMGDRKGLLETLRQINLELRNPLKIYYETMVDSKISQEVWMRYVQGFQGWAAGTIDPVTGEYTEYDGLSGNQLLLFQVIDAFLGLDTYLTEENVLRFIPNNQRVFREVIRKNSFRQEAKDAGDFEIEEEMGNIVKQMRVFRTAHRARVVPYLSVSAPERLIMTAGKSILEEGQGHDFELAMAPLDKMLADRLLGTK